MGFDLAAYLGRFDEVCRSKFKRTYDLAKLERAFAHLRKENQWLTASHVEKVFDPKNTPFAQYWPQPNAKELDEILRKQRVRLAPLPADPRELIQTLLGIFRNLGTTSVVLRFTYPESFGVFSTPVVNLLQVQRPKSVELYLAYCDELREWQAHFRLRRVADAEMALWTYQQLVVAEERSSGPTTTGSASARSAFEQDVWVQRRRAAQVLRPFFERYGPLELARILVEESPKLAGMIAGEQYERLLRGEASRLGLPCDTEGWADNVIGRLLQEKRLTHPQKTLLDRVWDKRNKAMHPGDDLEVSEVEAMIDDIEAICAGWKERPSKLAR